MKEYLDVLQKILDEGVEKESGRANMPNTIGISKADISMNLSEGFPLLTTKHMYWKGIVHELLWFLRGETNIKPLVDNKVNIWNGDGYRWYLKKCEDNNIEVYFDTMEKFVDFIKTIKRTYYDSMNRLNYELHNVEKIDETLQNHLNELARYSYKYKVGDLGKVYGAQWRDQNGVDQVKDVMDGLKNNPYSRYHIIDAWNKADFPDMALPPCHLLYQFIVRPLSAEDRWDLFQNVEWDTPLNMKDTSDEELHSICDNHNIPRFYLDLNMYQRSCDTFLGVPFNIASMSLLLMIMAETSNMIPGVANWIGGDTHMYVSHIDAVKEQLSRTPTQLPQVNIKRKVSSLEDICELTIHDFELIDYEYQDSIKAELFTGLKKK